MATGGGMSAIAVIRLSGPDAFEIGDKLFQSRKKIRLGEQPPYTIHFGKIVFQGRIIDEVLISVFKKPHSYTGEDTLEISCHGSTYIQQEILQALYISGAVPAAPGEFTLRAFLNGKMDLSQAEAVADLISSENRASHELAYRQLRGGYSEEIRRLRDELVQFVALIELELDFSTEDVEFADREQLIRLIEQILSVLKQLGASYAMGNVLKTGIPVTIAGRPNAGKSTLLNAILKEDRAIVTPHAGTTRDAIEDQIVLGGIAFRFIDTAGIRQTTDEIESLGIERSYDKIREAEITLYLFDAARANPEEVMHDLALIKSIQGEQKWLLPVGNKTDQAGPDAAGKFPGLNEASWISARDQNGLELLLQRLQEYVNKGLGQKDEHLVTNARHYHAINQAIHNLEKVKQGLATALPGDLLAMDIRAALEALSGITGQVSSDEVLSAIFGKFCIGK